MRWTTLYARSRQVPRSLFVAIAAAAVACLLWAVFSDDPTVGDRLMTTGVMLGTAALGLTLGTFDEELNRTAAHHWPLRRALHLLLALGVLVALALATRLGPAHFAPFPTVLRNVVGLLGLTALGAAVLGADLSWLGSAVWTLVCVLPFGGPSPDVLTQMATWPVQTSDATAATVSAVVLALAGATAYTFYGCPERAA
ncbi:hypothetical protein [Kineosporia sp. NBRC 101731]|uniref:hypothetical protein n=1 Tax=Kineosporia sp. NBRC 101731 TaxID=3032199 RepID=UPI0024A29F16|nr:hypothetical protein [Kineosporia sp. NBRC 101731]GLY32752.1 hypothetical protein Kisp02_61170 [Kineosporia sp. NBRC 101731]